MIGMFEARTLAKAGEEHALIGVWIQIVSGPRGGLAIEGILIR